MPKLSRPNILLICTDQQRFDSLGCYGNPHARTPHIDALARDGMVFETCYVQNPICAPSRASLMTGEYAHSHGLWANGTALPGGTKLFSQVLHDAGYDCGLVGKLHLAPLSDWQTEPRFADGFRVFEWSHAPTHGSPQNAYIKWLRKTYPEHYDAVFGPKAGFTPETSNRARTATPVTTLPVEAHYSRWIGDRTIAFIEEKDRPKDQPFFFVANFFDPHHPFGAPDTFRNLFDADKLPPPVGSAESLRSKPALLQAYSQKSYGGAAPGFVDYSEAELREIRAAYYAMVALIDSEVGRIMASLEQQGLANDTLVIFTSDHGEMLGDHALLLKGPMMFDCLTRVPLVMRWPGKLPAGSRREQIVQWIDLTSTILDAAGTADMPRAQGRSLLDLADGQNAGWREWALCEYRDSGHAAKVGPIHTTMLRWQQYKLVIWHGQPSGAHVRDGELYDLAADPDELTNLFHNEAFLDLRVRMYERMIDVMAATENRSQPRTGDW